MARGHSVTLVWEQRVREVLYHSRKVPPPQSSTETRFRFGENSATDFGHVTVAVTINGLLALEWRQTGSVCASKALFRSGIGGHTRVSSWQTPSHTIHADARQEEGRQFDDRNGKQLTARRARSRRVRAPVILDESEKERPASDWESTIGNSALITKNAFECLHYGKRYRSTGSSLVRVWLS